jgi:ABC-2 type transport system permease protein
MSTQTIPAPIDVPAIPSRGSADLEMVHRGKVLSVLIDSLILARRSLMRIPRQPDWLMGVTIMPIMFLLLFRYIFGGTVQATMPPGVSAVNFLVAGIIVQGLVFGCMNTALGLAQDAKDGIMDRFRVLPMTRSSVLLGRILADMAIATFTTGITILVGLMVGFRPTTSVIDWLAAIGLMLYLAFVLAWIGAVIGLWLKTIEAVNSIGFVLIFPLTFLSSTFVQPEFMPGWLQGFAENQPFTLVLEAVRGLLTGYPDVDNQGWIAVALLTGMLIVAAPLATWMFERRGKQ